MLINLLAVCQIATWTSSVYKHFKMPLTITVKKGNVVYIYTCIVYVFESE